MKRRIRGAAALALSCLLAAPLNATEATYLGTLDWPASAHGAGGFSGLELAEDGTRFTAITDKARIVTGRLVRENGRLVGIEADPARPLLNRNGAVQRKPAFDSEGLAIGPHGTLYVSFEGRHRVWAYDTPDRARALPRPPAPLRKRGNAGYEALAIDTAGRLHIIPERSGLLTRPFQAMILDAEGWRPAYQIPRRGGFLPVGADFGPDGHLYLLERAFTGWAFRSRLRRFGLDGDTITSEETVFTSAPLVHDNLEGLAIWRDATGALRATMISDDNLNDLQRTQFVEYRLSAPLARQAPTR